MSPAEQDAFDAQAAELKVLAAKQAEYRNKVNSAIQFASSASGEAWNGLFLMGLAMAGLELVPFSAAIRPRPYWLHAPEPAEGFEDWDISWMVEMGALLEPE